MTEPGGEEELERERGEGEIKGSVWGCFVEVFQSCRP